MKCVVKKLIMLYESGTMAFGRSLSRKLRCPIMEGSILLLNTKDFCSILTLNCSVLFYLRPEMERVMTFHKK